MFRRLPLSAKKIAAVLSSLRRNHLDELLPQDPDVREVSVALHEVEPVTDNTLIFDLEADIVSVDMTGAILLLAQQNTDANAARIRGLQFVADRSQRVTAVEDVVEDKNMPVRDVRGCH